MARQFASPADFEIVGMSRDPVPGDLDEIEAVAKRYADIGDAAEKAFNVLRRDGSMAAARGSSMDELREKIGDDLPDKLAKTMRSYQEAAQAYRAYRPRIEEAQQTFDRAVAQAREAAPQAGQTVPTLTAESTEEDRAARDRVQQAVDAGQAGMSAARGLAQQALAMRQQAENTCADALDRAADEAVPERNFFQRLRDFFADFPFVKILLGLLIAVVAVFFPVVGALLAGGLFALDQISAIATGQFSLGDFALGLLAVVPGAGLAIKGIGAGVKVAPVATRSAGGSIGNVARSSEKTRRLEGFVRANRDEILDGAVKEGAKRGVKEGAGEAAVEGGLGFAEGAGGEAARQVLSGEQLDAEKIAQAGGAGAVGAAAGGFAGGFAGGALLGGIVGGGRAAGRAAIKNGGIDGPKDEGTTARSTPATAPPTTAPPTTAPPAAPPPAAPPPVPPVPPGTLPAGLNLPANATGGIDLQAQEALGGHAIARHVGKTQAELDQRLNGTPASKGVKAVRPIPSASTFNDITVAERATSDNISAHQADINNFLSGPAAGPNGRPARLVINNPIPATDGITRLGPKNKNNPTPGQISQTGVSKVTTVLERDPSAAGGFRVITSFPEP